MSTKAELRATLSAARRAMTDADREAARQAVAAAVLARASGWATVAAYEPLRTEPGSTALLAGLLAAGVDVLVPITLPDRDLDWARWDGSREPSGRAALGLDAIAGADAVVVPALAVARDGTRLGRGGGSYDRALRRCRAGVPRVALLFAGELVAGLPRDGWDEPVTAVAQPDGWTDLDVAPFG